MNIQELLALKVEAGLGMDAYNQLLDNLKVEATNVANKKSEVLQALILAHSPLLEGDIVKVERINRKTGKLVFDNYAEIISVSHGHDSIYAYGTFKYKQWPLTKEAKLRKQNCTASSLTGVVTEITRKGAIFPTMVKPNRP